MAKTNYTRSVRVVEIQRIEFVSTLSFDEVLSGIQLGLGRPNFAEFDAEIDSIRDWDDYRAAVERSAGPAGLITFLELDIGDVISRDPAATDYRSVRIIAGNPVTMESMTRTSPAAGAFAPVTILVFEGQDGVHVRYDTGASSGRTELSPEAEAVALHLDEAVLNLITSAVRGSEDQPNASH